jgi:ribosomal protein L27
VEKSIKSGMREKEKDSRKSRCGKFIMRQRGERINNMEGRKVREGKIGELRWVQETQKGKPKF